MLSLWHSKDHRFINAKHMQLKFPRGRGCFDLRVLKFISLTCGDFLKIIDWAKLILFFSVYTVYIILINVNNTL